MMTLLAQGVPPTLREVALATLQKMFDILDRDDVIAARERISKVMPSDRSEIKPP
jgi:hypothetical protein